MPVKRLSITIPIGLSKDLETYKHRINISQICSFALSCEIDKLQNLDEETREIFRDILNKYTSKQIVNSLNQYIESNNRFED